jgi:hypothetical protein
MSFKPQDASFLKLVAITGMIGPLLFGLMLVLLTLAEYDFMRSLGWSPLVVIDWPSGLALGPYGGWMTAGFAGAGLVLMLFALGLRRLFPGSRAQWFFLTAGLAMLMLVFPTDPTFRSTPATWHGILHDSAYVILGLGFGPGMIALAHQFGRLPEWKAHARLTWMALVLIVPTFILKGVALYVFLFIALAWYVLISLHLWQVVQANPNPPRSHGEH